ncbi:hypothetical protein Aoki45_39500 [Algoriphagus sp. oki45]|uniref:hypothetical protein n=1 Tax=Algoriphagus sp. oki45 TaxID=3067294 RepID=UPI0027FEE980|nr:hypothetical protein Aoki45_39500 [Algoriphagus sp. oki45]
MLKNLCLLYTWIFLGLNSGQAQFVKEYQVADIKGFELVDLKFSSYKSQIQLRRSKSYGPLHIHGHLAQSNILPEFDYGVKNEVLSASLVHKNIETDNLGKSITSKLFSSNTSYDHSWDVSLNSNFLYDLNFNLGMGKSELDISHLSISGMKVRSASSDVKIFFGDPVPNSVTMDTLLVTLSMGLLEVADANFTNAREMIFEVDYGKIKLDFSDGLPQSCKVISAVSVGSVQVVLPPDKYPVKIKMNTTPMCRTVLPKYLKSLDKGVYVTKGFSASDPRLLEMIIDVGVGSVTIE